MSPQLFALLERLHGHIALLGLAVLLHPVITLRTRRVVTRWTLWTADLGALILSGSFALGWVLYTPYRQHVKPALYTDHLPVLLRFETKEHLGAMAVALAVAGVLALRAGGRHHGGRRAAWHLLLASWLLGLVTAGLGVYVAAISSPGW